MYFVSVKKHKISAFVKKEQNFQNKMLDITLYSKLESFRKLFKENA